MEWEPDVSAGDWLRERVDDPWRGTIHDFVPRGFPAYARILHPASVQSLPAGERLPAPEEWATLPWDRIASLSSRLRWDAVGWAEAAALREVTWGPTTPWHELIGRPWDAAGHDVLLDDGSWLNPPDQGRLDDDTMRALLPVIEAHTAAPADAYAAVWEGWGGLVGSLGYTAPSAALIGDADPRHSAVMYTSLRDVFDRGFRKPVWRPGLLSDEISRGPRLVLPHRDHVLFRGPLRDITRADVPWRETGDAVAATTPSIIWPRDRAWVVVTEVDADSTIVGGTAGLVAAIASTDGIEAVALDEGAVLSGDADGVGR
ncbi:hypothetical protein [Microbacterium telephonicum]|uniref:Uncharacterized protein n=1 Tax=Microbacterium telephonicum TaxID=1714841 RepID=A0A498CAC7_9MICO|nr:hypothetical protein [Microbacterium telephonicum]RLK52169.1 hypothetical protein C7474_0098 [Microbacterium telephonicum]